jgi:hypothetical protein
VSAPERTTKTEAKDRNQFSEDQLNHTSRHVTSRMSAIAAGWEVNPARTIAARQPPQAASVTPARRKCRPARERSCPDTFPQASTQLGQHGSPSHGSEQDPQDKQGSTRDNGCDDGAQNAALRDVGEAPEGKKGMPGPQQQQIRA